MLCITHSIYYRVMLEDLGLGNPGRSGLGQGTKCALLLEGLPAYRFGGAKWLAVLTTGQRSWAPVLAKHLPTDAARRRRCCHDSSCLAAVLVQQGFVTGPDSEGAKCRPRATVPRRAANLAAIVKTAVTLPWTWTLEDLDSLGP